MLPAVLLKNLYDWSVQNFDIGQGMFATQLKMWKEVEHPIEKIFFWETQGYFLIERIKSLILLGIVYF